MPTQTTYQQHFGATFYVEGINKWLALGHSPFRRVPSDEPLVALPDQHDLMIMYMESSDGANFFMVGDPKRNALDFIVEQLQPNAKITFLQAYRLWKSTQPPSTDVTSGIDLDALSAFTAAWEYVSSTLFMIPAEQ